MTKKRKININPNDPEARLCQAIIVQAADDYRRSLKVLKRKPRDYRTRLTWERALYDKQEVEGFFRSQWYQMLTEVDGEYLIKKLQSNAKFDMEDKDMDEMYHACRWCRSYTRGKCCRGIAEPDSSTIDWVYSVAESGQLSEVLEESLNSADQKDFKSELQLKLKDYKVSKKHIAEFMELFDGCMQQFLDDQCRTLCDENISLLYQNMPDLKSDGVTIKDPEEFCCKYFE